MAKHEEGPGGDGMEWKDRNKVQRRGRRLWEIDQSHLSMRGLGFQGRGQNEDSR